MRFRIICLLGLLILGLSAQAQQVFRITGDFSVKSKNDSLGSLTVGSFFFDKNESKLVYRIRFPREQLWVFADTAIYRFEGDSLIDRNRGIAIAEFSIFNLALNNDLSNYGLEGSIYSLDKVEKDQGMVISTWLPPKILDDTFGKVMVSTKGKLLNGIVFFNSEGDILRKQIFTEYQNFEGLMFPVEIVDIFFRDDKKIYQKTTYRNIVINEKSNQNLYQFELPAER